MKWCKCDTTEERERERERERGEREIPFEYCIVKTRCYIYGNYIDKVFELGV